MKLEKSFFKYHTVPLCFKKGQEQLVHVFLCNIKFNNQQILRYTTLHFKWYSLQWMCFSLVVSYYLDLAVFQTTFLASFLLLQHKMTPENAVWGRQGGEAGDLQQEKEGDIVLDPTSVCLPIAAAHLMGIPHGRDESDTLCRILFWSYSIGCVVAS